jgi:hypothetical protein
MEQPHMDSSMCTLYECDKYAPQAPVVNLYAGQDVNRIEQKPRLRAEFAGQV